MIIVQRGATRNFFIIKRRKKIGKIHIKMRLINLFRFLFKFSICNFVRGRNEIMKFPIYLLLELKDQHKSRKYSVIFPY